MKTRFAKWLAQVLAVAMLVATTAPAALGQGSISHKILSSEYVDIPGIAFGANVFGNDRIWVGGYCPGKCPGKGHRWQRGYVYELHPQNGQVLGVYSPPPFSWSGKGITGMAYDSTTPGGPYLWVASYDDRRVYQVRLAGFFVVNSFPLGARPVGGVAFDGTHLWVCTVLSPSPSTHRLLKMTINGGIVTTYPFNPRSGIDAVNGYVVLVEHTGTVEVRDATTFAIVNTAYFAPAAKSHHAGNTVYGGLGIDPATGYGYWGRRGKSWLYRMDLRHVIPGYTPPVPIPPPFSPHWFWNYFWSPSALLLRLLLLFF